MVINRNLKMNPNNNLPLLIIGSVIHGSGDGRKLGFPTANLLIENYPDKEKGEKEGESSLQLDWGVYAGRVRVVEKVEKTKQTGKSEQPLPESPAYPAVMHWGPRRVFDEVNPQLEVHILNFDGDLYEKILEVEVIAFIRESAKFETLEELKKQIEMDCERARELLVKL